MRTYICSVHVSRMLNDNLLSRSSLRVSVSGTTQSGMCTSVSGEDDALACCVFDKSTRFRFFQVDEFVLTKPRMKFKWTVLKVGDCIIDVLFQ